MSILPAEAASNSAVLPSSSLAVMLAPDEINFFKASVWPRPAASSISARSFRGNFSPGRAGDDAPAFAGARDAPGDGRWRSPVRPARSGRCAGISARSLAASSFPRDAAFCSQTLAAATSSAHPAARQIHLCEVELRACVVSFGGGLHPFEGQDIVLRYPASRAIQRRQPVLCFRDCRPPRASGGGRPHGRNPRFERLDRPGSWRRFRRLLPARMMARCRRQLADNNVAATNRPAR